MDDLGLSWIIMNFYTHRVYHGSSWIDPWARWDRSMAQRNVDFRCIPKFPALKILNQAPKRGRIFKEMVVSRSQNKILVIYGDFRIGESSQQVENMMKTCVSTSFFQVTRNVKAVNFYVECLQEVWFSFPPAFEASSWTNSLSPAWSPMERCSFSMRRVKPQIRRKWWQLRPGNWRVGSFCDVFLFPVVGTPGHWWKMRSSNFFGGKYIQPVAKIYSWDFFSLGISKKKRGEIDS